MPTYEMPLVLKVLSRPELVTALKRSAEAIFETGGFIRKIDNLGKHPTPYKMMQNSVAHREGNFFVLHFDVPPVQVGNIYVKCKRDVDILRISIFASDKESKKKHQCTLHEEMLPPAYRPEVQKMLEVGEKQRKKQDKYKFKFNTGLNYYPFQR